MAGKSKVDASLRSLLAKRPGWMTSLRTIDQFERERPPFTDDRAMVLLCVALIEQALEDAILARCTKYYDEPPGRDRLFGGDPGSGAINSLSAKITIAHAMHLYGDYLRDDLSRLRRIRNVFAHAKTRLSLDSPPIADALHFNLLDPALPRNFAGAERTTTNRGKFLAVCGLSLIHFYRLVRITKRHRPRLIKKGAVFDASPTPSPRKPKPPARMRPSRGDRMNQSSRPPPEPSRE